MRLKIKQLRLDAGKPVVFINDLDAKKMGLHVESRVEVRNNSYRAIAVADLTKDIVSKGEIALSKEIIQKIRLNSHTYVDVSLMQSPKSARILQGKIHCKEYTKQDLKKIMSDIVNNALTEAEVAYFVSGVNYCGMSLRETQYLTEAIYENGQQLNWGKRAVFDKHSIGGIPGNRTTPLVVSICASAGLLMPKTSSRAITSAAGTADTVESIAKVDLSLSSLKRIVKKTGACLAWGGALGLAPADDKLIQIEKVLNLDPEPQLLASILAKKLSVGSTHVLIDIPYGEGAKVSKNEARRLKAKFILLGKKLGLNIKVTVTYGAEPIGNGIGPALEMHDIIKILRRENGPKDLEKKSLNLAGLILEMSGKVKKGQGKKQALHILESGKAYKKFQQIISAQRGKVEFPKLAPYKKDLFINRTGKIIHIDNKKINYLARLLGCPSDKGSGVYLHLHCGELNHSTQPILTLYSESLDRLKEAEDFFKKSTPILIE